MKPVEINVGGEIFFTTQRTLEISPYFNSLFNGDWADKNSVFIDKDPIGFRYILNILRGDITIDDVPEKHKSLVTSQIGYFIPGSVIEYEMKPYEVKSIEKLGINTGEWFVIDSSRIVGVKIKRNKINAGSGRYLIFNSYGGSDTRCVFEDTDQNVIHQWTIPTDHSTFTKLFNIEINEEHSFRIKVNTETTFKCSVYYISLETSSMVEDS